MAIDNTSSKSSKKKYTLLMDRYLSTTSPIKALLLTVAAYIAFAASELTFLDTLDIDPQLIQITPYNMIMATVGSIAFYTFIEFIGFSFTSIEDRLRHSTKDNPVRRLLKTISYEFLLYFLVILLASITVAIFRIEAATTLVLLLISLLTILLFVSRIFSFIKITYMSLKYENLTIALKKYFTIYDRKSPRKQRKERLSMSREFSYAIGLIMIAVVCGAAGGTIMAKSESRAYYYLESSSNIKHLIIRNYNGTLVIKDYDIKTKQLQPGFTTQLSDSKVIYKEKVSLEEVPYNLSDYNFVDSFIRLFFTY